MNELPANIQDKFAGLCERDPLMDRAIRAIDQKELSEVDALKLAITILADRRDDLQRTVAILSAICPKRVRLPDGKILRWNAPDDAVWVEDIIAEPAPSAAPSSPSPPSSAG